jgi:hypothetical protein
MFQILNPLALRLHSERKQSELRAEALSLHGTVRHETGPEIGIDSRCATELRLRTASHSH